MGLAPLLLKQCSLRFSPSLGRHCLAAEANLWTNCTWRGFSAQPVPQEHGVGSDAEAAVAAEAAPPHPMQQSELKAQASQYKRQQELSASRNLLDLLNAASQRAYGPLFSGNITKGTAKRGAEVLLQFAPLRLLLSQYSHHGEFPATQEMLGKWERQLRLEWEALQKLVETYNRSRTQVMKAGAGADLPAADYFLRRWVPCFSEGVTEEIRKAEAGEYGKGDWLTYAPYVSLLPPDALCVLAVHTTMSTMLGESEAGSCKFVTVSSAIGKAINQQVAIELLKKGVRTETRRHQALVTSKKDAWKARQEAKERGELPDKRRLSQILSKYQDKVERHTASEREPTALPSFHPAGDAVKEAFLREQERFTSRISLLASDCGITEEDWFQGDPEYEACLTDLRKRFKHALRPRKQAAALDDHLRNELTVPTWSNAILAKLGAMMLQVLIRTAMVEVPARDNFNRAIPGRTTEQPAFEHAILRGLDKHGHAGDKKTSKGWWKRYGVVSMHDAVLARLRNNNFEWHDGFLPKYMPMIIPPIPWSGVYQGGYLTHSTCIMRARGSHRQIDLLKQADRTGRLNRVYEALNALGETAWSINEDVLEAVEYAYQVEGGGMAGLPLHSDKGEPAAMPDRPPPRYRTEARHGHLIAAVLPASGPEYQRWKHQAAVARKLCREMHSLRCDMNYKLAVAQAFRKEPSIYFPHNLDFRGRAYPMHPHLNHLGGDVNRGLLQFADAKPLGPSGLKWLKVSVANLFGRGADKLAFSGENGREQFAEDHLGQIMDSADDPFGGERWWLQGDSPWQLLAVCKDLRNALACACPEAYLSRLPVHQDGSCNGLQHYAALSRDESGGRAVNLAPVDRPQDVYTAIAIRVRQKMQEDADNGHPLAARLVDAVDRKLVKQTVMTSVYGVTFIGAREQIASRLRERGFPWQDWAELCKLSTYAAQVTLAGLHETFSDAKDIMKWLGTCAKVIASHGEAVQWSTPLGLPVVQPYRQVSRALVATLLQRVILVTADDSLPIMKSRQRSAFPPNYIHSLDSSHMLMTAVACKRAGLDFAGVHDSFWSHAGSVDTMNSLLREKFFELHSQPLLENLMQDFLTNPAYREINPEDYPELPRQGQLNLDQIRDARYFFS